MTWRAGEVGEEVHGEGDAVAGLDGLDLVQAVRVEGGEGQLLPGRLVDDAAAGVRDDEFAAGVVRGQ